MDNVLMFVWGFLAELQTLFGIIIVPAFLYGILTCINNAVHGKEIKEYWKVFILTMVTLLMLIAPSCASLIVN